jgi:hypothetical protein
MLAHDSGRRAVCNLLLCFHSKSLHATMTTVTNSAFLKLARNRACARLGLCGGQNFQYAKFVYRKDMYVYRKECECHVRNGVPSSAEGCCCEEAVE